MLSLSSTQISLPFLPGARTTFLSSTDTGIKLTNSPYLMYLPSETSFPYTWPEGSWTCQELVPGWWYPVPYPSHAYGTHMEQFTKTASPFPTRKGSPMSLTHQTWTPTPRTPLLEGSEGSASTITEGPGDPATPSTPLAPTMTGPTSQLLIKKSLALNKLKHGDSDNRMSMPEPSEDDGTLTSENPWTSSLPQCMETCWKKDTLMLRLRPRSSRTVTGPSFLLLLRGTDSMPYDQGPPPSSNAWRQSLSFLPTDWMIGFEWRGKTIFDRFVQDDEIFGEIDYDLPPFLQPLPDSPPMPMNW